LKGALLFELWTEQRYRPTRDADFLAHGDNALERFAHIFRELCVLEVDEDGLRFDTETVKAERISEDADLRRRPGHLGCVSRTRKDSHSD
jgi:hypothetical protein